MWQYLFVHRKLLFIEITSIFGCTHESTNEQEEQVRKFKYKSLLNLACSWGRLNINKNIFFIIRPPTVWKWGSYFWSIRHDEKGIKAKLYLNLLEWKLQSFSHKNIPQIAGKIFVTQRFFTDHLEHKIVKVIQLAECPQKIVPNCQHIS